MRLSMCKTQLCSPDTFCIETRLNFILEGISYLEDFSGSRGDDPEHLGLHHVLATVAHSCLDLHLEWNFSNNCMVQIIPVLDNFTKKDRVTICSQIKELIQTLPQVAENI